MTHPLESLDAETSLNRLQQYIQQVIHLRGFEHDSWEYVTVILAEEIGELAKALRKLKKLPANDTRQEEYIGWVSDEFADVLINLLDLANRFEVNLLEALRVKEQKHINRFGQ